MTTRDSHDGKKTQTRAQSGARQHTSLERVLLEQPSNSGNGAPGNKLTLSISLVKWPVAIDYRRLHKDFRDVKQAPLGRIN